MKGVIIEGVAGTGKSTLLSLLRSSEELSKKKWLIDIIDEEQTTGNLVVELRDQNITATDKCHRLDQLLPRIEDSLRSGTFMILERFHPTYYALMPDWVLVRKYDEKLCALGFGMVLLDLPNEELVKRSFHRPEMRNENWEEGLTKWYGSKELAVKAFIDSQENRRRDRKSVV